MTTPQSGREAFEAWAEREFGKVPRGAVLGLPATERFASYWKCWQAALAQQGREVGEAVAWHPVIAELHEHMRHCVSAADEGVDYAVSREMLDAMTTLRLMEKCGRGKWRPTEYGESFANTAAPKQQAVEVTEEMVDRALAAYNASRGTYSDEVPTDRDDMRAALLAALSGKTEVE